MISPVRWGDTGEHRGEPGRRRQPLASSHRACMTRRAVLQCQRHERRDTMQCQTDSETSTTTVHDIEPDGTEVARWQGGAAVLPPGAQFQLTGRFVPGEHGAQMGDLVERYRRTGHIHPRFDPLAHEPRPMAGV